MNSFISIDKHLAREHEIDQIAELAEAHGVSFEVMERYLAMLKYDYDDMFGDAKRYLEMHKERQAWEDGREEEYYNELEKNKEG